MTAEPASRSELDNLRSVVARCLSDVKATGLSHEQQFLIAYDAARTLALMVVRASGYRPKQFGGHYNTIEGLKAADPAKFQGVAADLQSCRMKRNDSEYDAAGGISDEDAEAPVESVTEFETDVEDWIKARHPALGK